MRDDLLSPFTAAVIALIDRAARKKPLHTEEISHRLRDFRGAQRRGWKKTVRTELGRLYRSGFIRRAAQDMWAPVVFDGSRAELDCRVQDAADDGAEVGLVRARLFGVASSKQVGSSVGRMLRDGRLLCWRGILYSSESDHGAAMAETRRMERRENMIARMILGCVANRNGTAWTVSRCASAMDLDRTEIEPVIAVMSSKHLIAYHPDKSGSYMILEPRPAGFEATRHTNPLIYPEEAQISLSRSSK